MARGRFTQHGARLGAATTIIGGLALAGALPAGAQAAGAPSRGTATGEIVSATVVALLAVVAVIALGVAHRRRGTLDPLCAAVEARTGRPAWAVLPTGVAGASLLVAVFGYYWDVSWHIDRGRDPGAFANPAHWFIIVGLDGIAFAGILALILGDDRSPRSVRLRPGWSVPVGGVLLALCGVVALLGFPLDDIWHRIFGQDVTAWGPTHIQMIGGASLATLAIWALEREGAMAVGDDGRPGERGRWTRLFDVVSGGAFLIGLSTLQVEFDFGVPQFQQVYHPLLIALAAGIGLVAVRIRAGVGAAIGAVAVFWLARGTLTVLVAPVLGRSTQHIPLYVVEALVVEAAARWLGRDRQVTLGLVAGLGIGTLGVASEWGWSQVWMPLPWGRGLLPAGILFGLVGGVAGGVVGALIGRALLPEGAPRQATPRGVATAAWAAIALALFVPLRPTVGDARVALAVGEQRDGAAPLSLTIDPPDAAEGARWFHVLAWQGAKQGDGGLEIIPLKRTGPGTYRAAHPVPVSGTWKTLVRLHVGSTIAAAPVYLPDDPAIPAQEVAATSGTRDLVREKDILQREATGGTPATERSAYAALAAIAAAWLGAMGWGLRRLDRPSAGDPPPPGTPAARPTTAGPAEHRPALT